MFSYCCSQLKDQVKGSISYFDGGCFGLGAWSQGVGVWIGGRGLNT